MVAGAAVTAGRDDFGAIGAAAEVAAAGAGGATVADAAGVAAGISTGVCRG
ncbi:hypothetical protein [Mycobacteroides abscessus]|uniref:hypothetical protein n=1 Tax=Mycobacteroides abscessus TaxID=36809 RepID=UPI0013F6770A|nr:hypothetical protein [Mycobacteroides abscessus]